jgi:hypothetical protein
MSETATEPAVPQGGEPAEPGSPAEPAGDAPLGAAGEKALAEWKQRAKAAERESKAHAARLQELEDRDKSEAQKAAERAAKAEVRALAATTFADPSDAAAFLDLAEFVDDEGDIDSKGIEKALADLLKRKPHLAKEAAPPSFDGGARTTAAPTDMNALIRQKAGLG